jgi:hypothetical protein
VEPVPLFYFWGNIKELSHDPKPLRCNPENLFQNFAPDINVGAESRSRLKAAITVYSLAGFSLLSLSAGRLIARF